MRELAALADVSLGALHNLESGSGTTLRTLVRVVRALDRADWLHALAPEVGVSPMQMLRERQRDAPQRRVRRSGNSWRTRRSISSKSSTTKRLSHQRSRLPSPRDEVQFLRPVEGARNCSSRHPHHVNEISATSKRPVGTLSCRHLHDSCKTTAELVVRGSFPEALSRAPGRRRAWFDAYASTSPSWHPSSVGQPARSTPTSHS